MVDSAHVLHRGVGAPVACKSCKALIVFAGNPTTGKLAPYEVDDAGDWVLRNGAAVRVEKGGQADMFAEPEQRYTSHFAKCPQAAQWRKSR